MNLRHVAAGSWWQLDPLRGLQWHAMIPARRRAQRHREALGKSCAVLGEKKFKKIKIKIKKKLAAECFSQFLNLTGEI